MPPRSVIETKLPPELKTWLEGELIRGGFSGYRKLTAELNKRLASAGIDLTVSRTPVQKFGRDVADRIADVRLGTEISKTLAQEVGDDAGDMNDAVHRLIQNKVLKLMMERDGQQLEIKDFVKLAHAAADVGRANTSTKKWQQLVRERARAVAEKVAAAAKKGGLTSDAVDRIRSDILGIASAP